MRSSCLAFVLLVACAPAPDPSESRVVGTWAHILPSAQTANQSTASLIAAARAQVARDGNSTTETFQADGTWITRHESPLEHRMHWTLLEDNPQEIRVTIEMPPENGGSMIRTFVVESNDLLREEKDTYAGMKLARVLDKP